MTPIDALAHQQRDARRALLARIDELGDLILMARQSVMIGQPEHTYTTAMRIRVIAIEEAAQILTAITEALDAAAALGQWSGQL